MPNLGPLTQPDPIDPNASAPSVSSVPSKNVLYGLIVGAVSAVVMAELKRLTADTFPEIWSIPEVVQLIPVLIGIAVAHFVPMTRQNVADRSNNQTTILATAGQTNDTTAKIVSVGEADAENVKLMRAGALPLDIVKQINAPQP